MKLAWTVLLLVVYYLPSGRSQPTVDVNPQKHIPGIGAIIGGNSSEKPVLDRWQFWLGIGLAAAISIVVAYFAYRGFKNYRKLKEERLQQQEIEDEEAAQQTHAEEGKTLVEKNAREPPSITPSQATPAPSLRKIDIEELARRTGRRKKDIMTTHAGHHHHHRSSSLNSEATSLSSFPAVQGTDTATL